MALRVYNTLSKQLEEFKPFRDREVRAYVCGLTVYDDMHIGHARTYVAFDVVFRYLKYRGYALRYVQNITDVDDKIIKKAVEGGVSPLELSREYAGKALMAQEKLGLLRPDAYPKVSESIPGIISAVQELVDKGNAYVTDRGVYFDVSTFPDYGRLSKQDTEQLSQHRIEPDSSKKTPLDFSLWKKSGEGEIGFESPWGFGRPGWHIECSVMSRKYLGEQFDIHGGALDLVFPHHENETAQSEALTGRRPFVKYWMHTGFLNSSGEKMSKSLGNILSVDAFLEKHSADAFRLFILQSHYRSPVDYGGDKITAAEKALGRLRSFRRMLASAALNGPPVGGEGAARVAERLREEFVERMDDDFDTPAAVAAVFEAVRKLNVLLEEGNDSRDSLRRALEAFDELTGVLGLRLAGAGSRLSEEDERLIEERNRYRREKNWAEADRIRSILAARGVGIADKGDGTTIITGG